jgi:hypothetical protein
MGKPLTIQLEDDARLESLKKTLGAPTKVDVLRKALDSLEASLKRQKRVEQWKRATQIVAKQSAKVNKEFQKFSLLKK